MFFGNRIAENSRQKNLVSMGSIRLWHFYYVPRIQDSLNWWLSDPSRHRNHYIGIAFCISFHLWRHYWPSSIFVRSWNRWTKHYANRNSCLLDVCIHYIDAIPHIEIICLWQQSRPFVHHFWVLYIAFIDN